MTSRSETPRADWHEKPKFTKGDRVWYGYCLTGEGDSGEAHVLHCYVYPGGDHAYRLKGLSGPRKGKVFWTRYERVSDLVEHYTIEERTVADSIRLWEEDKATGDNVHVDCQWWIDNLTRMLAHTRHRLRCALKINSRGRRT